MWKKDAFDFKKKVVFRILRVRKKKKGSSRKVYVPDMIYFSTKDYML